MNGNAAHAAFEIAATGVFTRIFMSVSEVARARVLGVQVEHLGEPELVAARHLPQAGHPRLHGEALEVLVRSSTGARTRARAAARRATCCRASTLTSCGSSSRLVLRRNAADARHARIRRELLEGCPRPPGRSRASRCTPGASRTSTRASSCGTSAPGTRAVRARAELGGRTPDAPCRRRPRAASASRSGESSTRPTSGPDHVDRALRRPSTARCRRCYVRSRPHVDPDDSPAPRGAHHLLGVRRRGLLPPGHRGGRARCSRSRSSCG